MERRKTRWPHWPSLAVTLWSVLGIFAGLALLGYAFLDTAFAGDGAMWINSDSPPPPVNRVSYTLLALRYFNPGGLLTGPHRALPLALGWLALTALLMGELWRRWRVGTARQTLRVSLLSLALVAGVGGLTLSLAQRQHNLLVQQPTLGLAEPHPVGMTTASVATLSAWRCTQWAQNRGCEQRVEAAFPNPTLWAVIGVFVTAGAGFWRPAGRTH